jgi:hypothetical protein
MLTIIRYRVSKIGQPMKIDLLSLPDQSQELEVIECVTLVNEMGGKTERI